MYHIDIVAEAMGNPAVATKRINANISEQLLDQAVDCTGQGITETIQQALELLVAKYAAEKALEWKGKIKLSVDKGRNENESGDR